jgi:hypothetical protein
LSDFVLVQSSLLNTYMTGKRPVTTPRMTGGIESMKLKNLTFSVRYWPCQLLLSLSITSLLTLMLLIAPMTATGIVQKMHKNHTNAVARIFIIRVFAAGLIVFFQIYVCSISIVQVAIVTSKLTTLSG